MADLQYVSSFLFILIVLAVVAFLVLLSAAFARAHGDRIAEERKKETFVNLR